jgi:histidinol-phosphate aminotransferase
MDFPSTRPNIEQLQTYKPNFGKSKINNLIRLSANESALGASSDAIKALKSFSNDLNRYPPQVSEELISVISNRYSLEKKKIILGNGSDELISILAQTYLNSNDEAIYTEFGFLQFPQAISIAGAKGVVANDIKFTANVDNILSKINKNTKIIFLANPNNPTGTYIPKKEVMRLHQSIPSNILLVYDAAYSEYVVNKDYLDGSELADANENVIMLRTFSKLHGLASLRLGWGYASEKIINNLMKVRGPFSINTAAIMAGVAAIQDLEFQNKSVQHNLKWMSWFKKELQSINLDFQSSITNFLLIRLPNNNRHNAQKAENFLASKGILVRGMKVYGLSNHLRVSIGNEEENLKFIKELKAFLEN